VPGGASTAALERGAGPKALLLRIVFAESLQGMKKRKHVRQSRYTRIVIALGPADTSSAARLAQPRPFAG